MPCEECLVEKRPWIWVDTPEKLHDAREEISRSAILSVDTEYDSLRYFREILCVIQIDADSTTYLFDPLSNLPLSFLGEPFSNKEVLKIFHAGDNDIRILKRDYGFEFRNVFDTQKAAAILGFRHLSLPALVSQYLGIEFSKEKRTQRSKWDTRPLKKEQILYAVCDTQYLKALYHVLSRELLQKNLKGKAERVFADMEALTWKDKVFDPHKYKRMKGYESLTEAQQNCLKHLYRWRFRKAKETNRALFRIVSDTQLVELARSGVTSLEKLFNTGILSPEKILMYGEEIVQMLKRSK